MPGSDPLLALLVTLREDYSGWYERARGRFDAVPIGLPARVSWGRRMDFLARRCGDIDAAIAAIAAEKGLSAPPVHPLKPPA
jgi:hypothetical protein